MPTNDHDLNQPAAHDSHVRDSEHPGYEITDVNAGGIAVFLAGLFGSVIVFFFLCYGLGILINGGIKKDDGPTTKWNTTSAFAGSADGKRQDLASNPEMQQREYQQMTSTFPEPRLDIDDGNQATADLHAREDLLLNNYSQAEGGAVRIPISRAMELDRAKGIAGECPGSVCCGHDGGRREAGDSRSADHRVLRERDMSLTRSKHASRRLSFRKASGETKAELAPVK